MNHTPGPWGFEDKTNREMVTAGRDRKGAFVYVCDPSYSPHAYEGANARLIAAAPDLLLALRAMLKSAPCRNRCKKSDMTCASRRAEAAVRKAVRGSGD